MNRRDRVGDGRWSGLEGKKESPAFFVGARRPFFGVRVDGEVSTLGKSMLYSEMKAAGNPDCLMNGASNI